MQQLIGMVDTARKLLTAQPAGAEAAAGAAAHAMVAPAGMAHEAAAAAAEGAHLAGSAFHLPAVQPPKNRSGGRKRKGEWACGLGQHRCLAEVTWDTMCKGNAASFCRCVLLHTRLSHAADVVHVLSLSL